MMKRDREAGEIDAMDMANCLMLLSTVGQNHPTQGRVFACKTCNKRFSSFQALGGHRASHKKPRVMGAGDQIFELPTSPKKPKTHECSICGLEFPIGQALGGHMRRHRAAMTQGLVTREFLPLPVLKKSNSSKRVLCLDLNLTPTENDVDLGLGRLAACS